MGRNDYRQPISWEVDEQNSTIVIRYAAGKVGIEALVKILQFLSLYVVGNERETTDE